MAKQAVKLVFDRRKRVEATGKGNVEFIIQLSRLAVKKIIVDSMTLEEWESYKNAPFLKKEMANTKHARTNEYVTSGCAFIKDTYIQKTNAIKTKIIAETL